jgi:hypothetical protein
VCYESVEEVEKVDEIYSKLLGDNETDVIVCK